MACLTSNKISFDQIVPLEVFLQSFISWNIIQHSIQDKIFFWPSDILPPIVSVSQTATANIINP
jgi:hypothetical protein